MKPIINYTNNTFTYTDIYGSVRVYDLYRWNLLSETFADGRKWVFTYDNNGNVLSTLLPNGFKIEYTYDKHGNILGEKHSNGMYYDFTLTENES
jgi:YD repeat-containing protein